MGRYNSYPECSAPSQSLESVLRVGQIRIRPYKSGSIKHAHIVLRKVDEEMYEDRHGMKCSRAVYSFFASKVINCKPGKEIFFAIDDYLDERVVTFEADTHRSDGVGNDVIKPTSSEETLVQQESQSRALPPKMRKMWARKEAVTLNQDATTRPAQARLSVGIQATPQSESIGVQKTSTQMADDSSSHAQSISVKEEVPLLSESVRLDDSSCAGIHVRPNTQGTHGCCVAGVLSPELVSSVMEDMSARTNLSPEPESRTPQERSLSPMDLESVSSMPHDSPRISVLGQPGVKPCDGSRSSGTPRENTGELHAKVSRMSIRGTRITVKKEPGEFALPSSSNPRRSSLPFRTPVFVPARHNPLHENDDNHDQGTSLLSTPLETPSRSQLNVISDGSEARLQPSYLALSSMNHSADCSARTEYLQADPSLDKKDSRERLRSALTFVPATRPSGDQRSRSPGSQTSSLSLGAPPIDAAQRSEPSLTHRNLPTPKSTNSKKRRRTPNTAFRAVESEPLLDIEEMPSKKWKSIVKQEPHSPVLPMLRFPGSISSSPDAPEVPRPSPLISSVSQPKSPLSLSPAAPQGTPTPVKVELLDHHSLTVDRPLTRQPPIAPAAFRNSGSLLDHTTFRPQYHPIPSASVPVEPYDRPCHRMTGLCSSLPVLKTAQIRMESNSRDTVGIRAVVFDPSGDRFAVVCRDNTVRIWDNTSSVEIAKLAHSSPVISATWMTDDTSIVSMGSNGVISKWTLVGSNKWMWEKLVDAGEPGPSCFAYCRRYIAVAYPRNGVRIWEWRRGLWMPLQREVYRKEILSIKFVNDGNELLCGCSDGNLLRCAVPDCKFQQITTFKTKVFHVDADPSNSCALVAQALGSAHLVDYTSMIRCSFNHILQDYPLRDAEQQYGARGVHSFKPIFADYGDAVIFGEVEGRVLIWDRKTGRIIHEMDHGNGVVVQAVANFEGESGEQHLVSCTKYGLLTWWRLPVRLF